MAMIVSIESPDLDRQIELLKFYPEIARKHFKPALRECTLLLEAAIRPAIPVRTGLAQQTFGSKVTGTTISTLKSQTGWSGKGTAWYMNVLEYGSVAHEIEPRNARILALDNGAFATHVKHPGITARPIVQHGFEAAKPGIEGIMSLANEACVQELVVR